MKTFQRALTISALAVFLMTATAYAQVIFYPDIPENHRNANAIHYLTGQNVFEGYPDGTFGPDITLNRAEQLKTFMFTEGYNPDPEIYNNCFPDVTDQWFAPPICMAKALNAVEGYPDGLFHPEFPVNRAEGFKMLGELQNWDLPNPVSDPFPDVPADEWYAPYAYFAMDNNLVPFDGELFNPAGGFTRANTAETLFRSVAVSRLGQPYTSEIETEIIALELRSTEVVIAEPEPIDDTTPQLGMINITEISPENEQLQVDSFFDVFFEISFNDGTPVEDSNPDVYFWQPNIASEDDGSSPVNFFGATHLGDGQYHAQVTNTISGSQTLVIHDPVTHADLRDSLTFLPGPPSMLDVTETLGPPEQSIGVRKFDVALLDSYNNIIPEGHFEAWAGFGDLTFKNNHDGTAEFTFAADGYGATDIHFQAELDGVVRDSIIPVDILPFAIGGPPGYEVSDALTEVPLLFYIPQLGNEINNYQFQFDVPENLELIGFSPTGEWVDLVDFEQNINEDGTTSVYVNGTSMPTTHDGPFGHLVFQGFPEGDIEIGGAVDLESENYDVPEKLYRGGGTKVAKDEKKVYVPAYSRPLVAIKGKPEKKMCINAFIEPGIGVTLDDVKADAKQAEDIFYKNALNCNCPHFLKIEVSGLVFSKDEWSKFKQGGEEITNADVKEAVKTGKPIDPMDKCTVVVYTDDIEGAGESYRDNETDELDSDGKIGNHVMVNNAKDLDGRTLAHELTHHLSGNKVKDPHNGRHQGAGKKGNLMSYDEANEDGTIKEKVTGDDLTKTQCELIAWDHWRF